MPPYGGASTPAPYNAVEAVKYGWNKFSQNAAPFAILALALLVIAFVITFAVNILTTGVSLGTDNYGSGPSWIVTQLVSLAGSMVVTVIVWVLGIAMARGALDVVDTGQTDLGAMFSRIDWAQAIIAAILVAIAVDIGFLLLVLPGIVLAFLLSYTNLAVVDGVAAIDAIKASYRFTTGHLGETLIFALIGVGLSIVGVCTCGLGLIVILPVLMIGLAYTWRVLQGRPITA